MGANAEADTDNLDHTKRRIMWVVCGAFVLLLILLVALDRSFSFGLFGDDGPKIEVQGGNNEGRSDPPAQAPANETAEPDSAPVIEATQPPTEQANPVEPAATSYEGEWFDPYGDLYVIEEFGGSATMSKFSRGVFVSSAEGAISRGSFQFAFQDVQGSFGEGQLTISSDGLSLSGVLTDGFTTIPLALSRQ